MIMKLGPERQNATMTDANGKSPVLIGFFFNAGGGITPLSALFLIRTRP
jgi:hypothetical protein